MQILVFDSYPDIAPALAAILKTAGDHEVEAVTTFEAALRSARERPPQVVFLGLAFLDDGSTSCEQLRKLPGLDEAILVAMVTSLNGISDEFDYFLLKPFSARKVLSALEIASPQPEIRYQPPIFRIAGSPVVDDLFLAAAEAHERFLLLRRIYGQAEGKHRELRAKYASLRSLLKKCFVAGTRGIFARTEETERKRSFGNACAEATKGLAKRAGFRPNDFFNGL